MDAGHLQQISNAVLLTLQVSLTATAISAAAGLPLGVAVATAPRRIRDIASPFLNAMMGLPPVVVGLLVYLVLSRSGPLGSMRLLYTPAGMVIAQTLLICPIVIALTKNHADTLVDSHCEQLVAMGAKGWTLVAALLWEARFALITVVLAGAGRAFAEVGAVMIVGGNIEGVTRVITTTIATETNKGDISVALGLGAVLIALVLVLNVAAWLVRRYAVQRFGA